MNQKPGEVLAGEFRGGGRSGYVCRGEGGGIPFRE